MAIKRPITAFAASLLLAGAALAQSGALALPETIQFNRDIRPILSDRCFTCHGPDKNRRVTEFHFDVEGSAKADIGGGRHPVIAGDPGKSILLARVAATDEKRRMPPPSSGPALSPRDVALLTRWIEQGAKWEKHWAFNPPQRPATPPVKEAGWVKNPIDAFVLNRLEQENLKPSAEADRAALLRRVSIDLTGIPPAIAELNAFLADKSPNAYEKVVDRLLASPRYGERMAMPWLDAARYADSSGYQLDYERFMWRWRDYVINAFNHNMPFNQFAIEQIAGDMLPNATLDQKIATAFNRNHRTNSEGGIIPEEFAAEYVVDRVATTSSVFLGVTMGCARCHDHKYDPFSQKEFYQLFAYFNNVPELGKSRKGNTNPYIKAPTTEEQARLTEMDGKIDAAASKVQQLRPALDNAEKSWLTSLAGKPALQYGPTRGLVGYYPLNGDLQATVAPPKKGPTPSPEWNGDAAWGDGAIGKAASFDGKRYIDAGDVGDFEGADRFSVSAWIYPTAGTGAIVTRTLDEPQEKGYLLQLADSKVQFYIIGRWFDSGLHVETEQPITMNQWHHVVATYNASREARGITLYVDGRQQAYKVQMDIFNLPSDVKAPLRIGAGGGPENRFHGLIDEVRVYGAELTPREAGILSVSRSVNELAEAAGTLSKAEADKIEDAYLASDAAAPQFRSAWTQLAAAKESRDRFYDTVSTVMVMEEMPKPRESHILLRGSYDQPGEQVTPGVPAIFGPMPPDLPRNRLGLAKWLVDPSNPLTARVAVNRFWQMYFGTGIVKTADDFGSQGEAPSHPELLDWLATEFIRTGWDVKQLQKTIVTSATYRQTSKASPELEQRDPENRLLARASRFRLPAELVRDQALASAGLLVEQVGGPSVKPYQPEGLWADLTEGGKYVQDHGEKLYRRTVYTFWKRTILAPMLANFDAPSRESCIILRSVTNSPLQALDLMNDVTYLEAARMLAERVMREGGSAPADRISLAFLLATARRPGAKETDVLLSAYQAGLDHFQTKAGAAEEYLKQGEHPRDPKLELKQLAAYTTVTSLIMNLDETVTRE